MLKQLTNKAIVLVVLFFTTQCALAEGIKVIGVDIKGEEATLKKIELNWYERKGDGTDLSKFTVKDDTNVLVHVTNFNFVHYELDSNITEIDIEAAGFLIDLYSSLFSLTDLTRVTKALIDEYGIEALEATPKNEFEIWYESLKDLREKTFQISNSNKTSSAFESVKEYENFRKAIEQRVSATNANRELAFLALTRGRSNLDPQTFKLIREKHIQIVDYATTVLGRVNQSINGKTIVVGKKQRGTAVSLDLVSVALSSAAPKAEPRGMRVEYLVKGQIPLIFHSGLTYSALKDASFETLQELSGSEFQTRVVEGDETIGLSLFASYPLSGKITDDSKWFFTLGTDITDIGDTVYGGFSYSVTDRLFLSAGLAYGDTVETNTMSAGTTSTSSNSEQRDIIQIVQQERDTQPFIAISYKFF